MKEPFRCVYYMSVHYSSTFMTYILDYIFCDNLYFAT